MTKVNESVKENGVATMDELQRESKITLGEVYGVSRSIFELSSSVPSMKGKIVYSLSKNEALLEKILTKADKDRGEMLKKYVKLDKDGQFKYIKHTQEEIEKGQQPVLDYKSEAAKVKAATEIQSLMEAEVDIEFHKIEMREFDNLDIVPQRNQSIGLFMKYLITETPILRMN
jgi:hypothetical protein